MNPEDVYGDHSVGIHDSTDQMSDLLTYELHSSTLVRQDDDAPAVFMGRK